MLEPHPSHRLTILWTAILAVLVLSAGQAAAAPGADTTNRAAGRTLTIGVQQGYNLLPVFAGLRNGYFKKAGITGIKFVVFASTPAMFAAAAQGQLDLGYQAIPGLVAYNRATSGTKLKIVGANTWDSSMFFARTGSGVVSATKANWQNAIRSLKGKKVGLPVPRGLQDVHRQVGEQAVGARPDGPEGRPVGGRGQRDLSGRDPRVRQGEDQQADLRPYAEHPGRDARHPGAGAHVRGHRLQLRTLRQPGAGAPRRSRATSTLGSE